MIPGLQQRQAQAADCGHARSRGDTAVPTFHDGQAFFEDARGRIGETRINVSRLITRETRGRLRGILEDEARGGEDGLAVFELSGTVMPASDREGVKPWGVICHGVSPKLKKLGRE
jgi:hypothetical protein